MKRHFFEKAAVLALACGLMIAAFFGTVSAKADGELSPGEMLLLYEQFPEDWEDYNGSSRAFVKVKSNGPEVDGYPVYDDEVVHTGYPINFPYAVSGASITFTLIPPTEEVLLEETGETYVYPEVYLTFATDNVAVQIIPGGSGMSWDQDIVDSYVDISTLTENTLDGTYSFTVESKTGEPYVMEVFWSVAEANYETYIRTAIQKELAYFIEYALDGDGYGTVEASSPDGELYSVTYNGRTKIAVLNDISTINLSFIPDEDTNSRFADLYIEGSSAVLEEDPALTVNDDFSATYVLDVSDPAEKHRHFFSPEFDKPEDPGFKVDLQYYYYYLGESGGNPVDYFSVTGCELGEPTSNGFVYATFDDVASATVDFDRDNDKIVLDDEFYGLRYKICDGWDESYYHMVYSDSLVMDTTKYYEIGFIPYSEVMYDGQCKVENNDPEMTGVRAYINDDPVVLGQTVQYTGTSLTLSISAPGMAAPYCVFAMIGGGVDDSVVDITDSFTLVNGRYQALVETGGCPVAFRLYWSAAEYNYACLTETGWDQTTIEYKIGSYLNLQLTYNGEPLTYLATARYNGWFKGIVDEYLEDNVHFRLTATDPYGIDVTQLTLGYGDGTRFALRDADPEEIPNLVLPRDFLSAEGDWPVQSYHKLRAEQFKRYEPTAYIGGSDSYTTSSGSTSSETENKPAPAPEITKDKPVSTEVNNPDKIEFKKNGDTEMKIGDIGEKQMVYSIVPQGKTSDIKKSLEEMLTREDRKRIEEGATFDILFVAGEAKLSTEQKTDMVKLSDTITDMIKGVSDKTSEEIGFKKERKETDGSDGSSTELDKFAQKAKESAATDPKVSVGTSYDFHIEKKIGDDDPVKVSSLGEASTSITFNLSEGDINRDPDVKRSTFMVHFREDGTKSIQQVVIDPVKGTGTITIGDFSTFVLIHVDVPAFVEKDDVISSPFGKYNAYYRVIKTGDENGKVGKLEYLGPVKTRRTTTVASKVKIDGITYKVVRIADSAFEGNKYVKKIKIGKNVKEIGEDAFKDCPLLKDIVFLGTPIEYER